MKNVVVTLVVCRAIGACSSPAAQRPSTAAALPSWNDGVGQLARGLDEAPGRNWAPAARHLIK
jgi:hypothetical protein